MDVPGWALIESLFRSMKRNKDRAPKKQLSQDDGSGLGQDPDNGLLVTHINQAQDLLVKTFVL